MKMNEIDIDLQMLISFHQKSAIIPSDPMITALKTLESRPQIRA